MATPTISKDDLKQALKEVMMEALQEQRGLIQELLAEALEDFALTEAIREGQATPRVTREVVVRALRRRA